MLAGAASLLVLLALVPSVLGALRPPRPSRVRAPSRIVGRVVDARTRAGIGSVQVRLDNGVAEVTTAADGAFEFADVAEGRHQLVAALAGFAASGS